MARGPCTFKQRDATRAARAVLKAGLNVQRVEIDKDGKIVVVIGKTETANEPATDFDRWKAKHARSA